MNEEGVDLSPESKIITRDNIKKIVETFVSLGITKIRLTGGEPLVRKDVIEII